MGKTVCLLWYDSSCFINCFPSLLFPCSRQQITTEMLQYSFYSCWGEYNDKSIVKQAKCNFIHLLIIYNTSSLADRIPDCAYVPTSCDTNHWHQDTHKGFDWNNHTQPWNMRDFLLFKYRQLKSQIALQIGIILVSVTVNICTQNYNSRNLKPPCFCLNYSQTWGESSEIYLGSTEEVKLSLSLETRFLTSNSSSFRSVVWRRMIHLK